MRNGQLDNIVERLQKQYSLLTDNPVFIVQQKKRYYGYADNYADGYVQLDIYGNETDKEHADTVGYKDTWEYVTSCFTEKGCQDYIKQNKDKLAETRIITSNNSNNTEYQVIYDHLYAMGTNKEDQSLAEGREGAIISDIIQAVVEMSQINGDTTEVFVDNLQKLLPKLFPTAGK